jgi:hypothetical protein
LVASCALILMSVAWVEGQPGSGKGGIPGFGGFQNNPIILLNREEVKKELKVTDEQLERLTPEVMAAIAKVLDEKQFNRFRQIDLQQRGNNAFKDAFVVKELKITDEQKTSIVSLINDSEKEIKDLTPKKGGFGKDGQAAREKQDAVRKETKEKIFGVLTKDQRKAYRELIGEEFKLTPFGGGGNPKKDAKKDTE